jgi:formamidopyrimidine-DNA glycosylase
MTGRLIVADRESEAVVHTHLRIAFERWRRELRFIDPRRFGGIWLLDGRVGGANEWFGRRLPPTAADPLTKSLEDFRRALNRRRQIKALLLDQRPISGVGNIYCDESLHRAQVHPRTRASELDATAVGRVWKSLRRVLEEAVRAGGSSISDYRTSDDEPGMFQLRHRVYGREGRACRRCGRAIVHLVVAGRSTFICPRCQPG